MTNERKAELFQGAMSWIWMHTEGYSIDEYVRALKNIGFTEDEIKEDLLGCTPEDEDEWEEPDWEPNWDDDEYVPSAENGDYSPSNPWDAPGMKQSDFI